MDKMTGNGWHFMILIRNGWKWLEWPDIAGYSRKWMDMEGMPGNGW